MDEKTGQLSVEVADDRRGTNFLIPQELDTDPPLRLRPLRIIQLQRQCQLLNLKPAPYVRSKSGQPCTFGTIGEACSLAQTEVVLSRCSY